MNPAIADRFVYDFELDPVTLCIIVNAISKWTRAKTKMSVSDFETLNEVVEEKGGKPLTLDIPGHTSEV